MSRRLLSLVLIICASFVALLTFLAMLNLAPSAAARPQAELHVCADGCAYSSIQAAVDAAGSGDVIKVATGVYTGVNTVGNMTQLVYISKSLSLRGGYPIGDWTTSDPIVYPTVLEAENLGRGVLVIGAIDVTLDGLQIIHGRATGMGGFYLSQYTCDVQTGTKGAGGGVCVQGATVTLSHLVIMSNTASTAQGYGGGLFASNAILTLTHSTLQANNAATGLSHSYGGGLHISGGRTLIEDNVIANNSADPNYDGDGGGAYIYASAATLHANLIEGNEVHGSTSSGSRLGGGGVAVEGAGATIINNEVRNNHAPGYTGGGLAWKTGTITVAGNLIVSNTAHWGGGVYAGNAAGLVDNNVIADNTTSNSGSALYIETYNPIRPNFRHNTIARNTGGNDSAIYVASYGRAQFTNTIIAENIVGIAGGSSVSILLDRTLWDNNITDTTTVINEVGHVTGTAAFAIDGYHLTEASAAVDAGVAAGVTTDIDDEVRPQGHAPDLGADESPYFHGPGGEGISAEKIALPPRLMMTSQSIQGAPAYVIQQEYLIRLANNLTDTSLSAYHVTDLFPAVLDFSRQTHYPPMIFQNVGDTLDWQATTSLAPESLAWMSLAGNATLNDGGTTITNVATISYTLSTGQALSTSLEISSTIPNFPPFIAWPENGEFCLNRSGEVELKGLARPGATIFVYEDGVYQTQTVVSTTGEFRASYLPAQWANNHSLVLTTKDCTGGSCGTASNAVTVRAPDLGWCPQRSIWTKQMGENLMHWPFRDETGNMATSNWVLPGAYGFNDTELILYQCEVPDAGYSITSINVEADGVMYQDENGPDTNGAWNFSIGYAHSVNIVVSAENSIGATKVYNSHGNILIDPDGFIFDVTQGLDIISSTVDGVPIEVSNTLAGVTVTAYMSMPTWGGWVPWPAHLYNDQVNPQVTGDDGYFAFFTPPGFYYLNVQGTAGYQSWRSPVVQVITEIVHVNVPLTPWTSGSISSVKLTPAGPNPATITIPIGSAIEWVSQPNDLAAPAELIDLIENPILRPLSALDPLIDTLGFDGGRLTPGQTYRRVFDHSGACEYSDGLGHTGWVMVVQRVNLPLIIR